MAYPLAHLDCNSGTLCRLQITHGHARSILDHISGTKPNQVATLIQSNVTQCRHHQTDMQVQRLLYLREGLYLLLSHAAFSYDEYRALLMGVIKPWQAPGQDERRFGGFLKSIPCCFPVSHHA